MLNIKPKLTISIITFFLTFAFAKAAFAATEFVSVVDPGNMTGTDYTSLSAWETGMQTDLTAATTLVFAGTKTGTIADNATVTGATSGATATVVHATATQILLETISGGPFQNGEQIQVDVSNYFTTSDTGDSAIAVAKCRTSNGAADTTAVAIDGWTTSATNYIKIWADPSESYRHQGKWDVNKYRLEPASFPVSAAMRIYEEYVRVDGLQIQVAASASVPSGVYCSPATATTNIQLSNNIIKGQFSGTAVSNAGIMATTDGTTYAWNNIIYGFINGANQLMGVRTNAAGSIIYAYNNTVYGNNRGIDAGSGSIIAKNNLSYGNTDNYVNSLFDGTSTNNLSGPGSDAQTPVTNARNGYAVTFADEANSDFHIDSADTGARNQGADLSADAAINVTTDVDNETHRGTFDIGADENVAKIYRSVGPNATSALAAGSSLGNVEIKAKTNSLGSTVDYIATFWGTIPDAVGVGDALQYDSDNNGSIDAVVFITKRYDSSHYSVRTAAGAAPTSTTVPDADWGVYRSYISLSLAEAGTENTGLADAIENFDTGNVNLTTNNLQWNIACYANSTTADQTAIQVSGWTTTADNYMKIYTPTRSDEVGVSQRASGKWDTTKYYLSITDAEALRINADFIRVDGLQITTVSPTAIGKNLIRVDNINAANDIRISNCILQGNNNATYWQQGIYLNDTDIIFRGWNNIAYNFNKTVLAEVFYLNVSKSYLYNNTVYTGYTGFRAVSGTNILKNNVAQNCSAGYVATPGTFDASSNYNLSDLADAPGSNPQNSKTVTFVSTTGGLEDLHLAPGDSSARNIGTDLSNDLYLPLNTDIDSSASRNGRLCDATNFDTCNTRPYNTLWDIGADELITKIYRSVAPDNDGDNSLAALATGGSNALTVSGTTATFASGLADNIGVGDVLQYDSNNNGSIGAGDVLAFITARTDSTHYTISTSTGAAPTARAADTTWSIFRSYTSLANAESGTENTAIDSNLRDFDAGNRDIAANSEQWYFACYANGTTADTAAVTIAGWTTKPQNYIKIFTPTLSSEVGASQRQQGKWDSNKYALSVNGNVTFSVREANTRIDGLQLDNTRTSGNGNNIGILMDAAETAADIRISNSLFRKSVHTDVSSREVGIESNTDANITNGVVRVWNNIFYGFNIGTTATSGIYLAEGDYTFYIYNNTFQGDAKGINVASASLPIAKNNITQSCTDGYNGNFTASSDYNISDVADDAPGAHSKNATTVSFLSTTGGAEDFHLAPADTAARDAGADLSQDYYLPIISDIDGQARNSGLFAALGAPFTADIGADEGSTAIYRSLAPGNNNVLATTTQGGTLSVSGNVGTFTTAPGATIGVGDAIQYDSDNNGSLDSIAFITYRTDSTHYNLQARDGTTPNATSAADADWSIYRAYVSLSNAEAGTEDSGITDGLEHFDIDWSAAGGKDIYAKNQQWNIACYANGILADATNVTINGWNTYPTNYLKIYTPTAATEVGISQRHQGKLDSSKYMLSVLQAGSGNVIGTFEEYVRIEGLQIYQEVTSSGANYPISIQTSYINNINSDIRISNNILKAKYDLLNGAGYGTAISAGGFSNQQINIRVWNNIIYDYVSSSGSSRGITAISGNAYVYNNTFQHSTAGISNGGGSSNLIAINNILKDAAVGSSICGTGSGYNTTDRSTLACGTNNFTNQTISFVDEANDDFHLASTDAGARNIGYDLSSDANITSAMGITTDVDGHSRNAAGPTGVWDIGADEGAIAVYYSVGQNVSDHKTGSPTVTISSGTATFSVAQTATNMGVGDVLTAGGNTYYLSQKTDTTHWKVVTVLGATPADLASTSVTSITHAFASLEGAVDANTGSGAFDASHLNTSDLYSNNYQLNIPCYYDTGADTTTVNVQGWTTYQPNHIRIYTPSSTSSEVNQSQRHSGKWDNAKYRISLNGTGINIYSSNTRVDGIQVDIAASAPITYSMGIKIPWVASGGINSIYISNNIIKETNHNGSSGTNSGIYLSTASMNDTVWNNLVYDMNTSGESCVYFTAYGNNYIYNNTVNNCSTGFTYLSGGTAVLKNNIAQNTTTGYTAGFATASDYNVSDHADAPGTPGSNNKNSATVSFADATNKDFHLAASDTTARNAGANLSADSNWAFSTDIDGNTRNIDSRGWDIGADEAATNVYYSVGQSASDLKTGTPTVTIATGVATFSASQTGNIGVGDVIDYDADNKKAYIVSKTSDTVWTVQTATSTVPSSITAATVNSIKHVYTSLSAAEAGAADSSHLNSTDLVTSNYVLNIPCYYDSGADTTTVTIDGWSTGIMNFIKVYTPSSISTEANVSQRHSGEWDGTKYSLDVDSTTYPLNILEEYVKIDGLQVSYTTSTRSSISVLRIYPAAASETTISNNIIRGVISGSVTTNSAITANGNTAQITKIYNNVIYGFSCSSGFGVYVAQGTAYVYNNTVTNNYRGIDRNGGTLVAKNNLAYNNDDNYFGTIDASSTNNLSGPTQTDAPGSNPQNGKTVNFVDLNNYDYHLVLADTNARENGADLSADANLTVTTDIDGNPRPTLGAFDIGADEGATAIYRSVAPDDNGDNSLAALSTGASNAMTVSGSTATFTTALPDNIGVGDVLQYDSNNNGSIGAGDALAFITGRIDSQHYTVETASGAAPTARAADTTWSIFRAYTSLSNAEAATENTSIDSNLRNFDSWSGGKDIKTSNEQWNIACYANGTTADSTTVTINGWTTYATDYIRIYTPAATSEVGTSQRHSGKWDTTKYHRETGTNSIIIQEDYVKLEGLQLQSTYDSGNPSVIWINALTLGANKTEVSSSILKGVMSGTAAPRGLYETSANNNLYFWNNIIQDWTVGGYSVRVSSAAAYIYNNTFINNNMALYVNTDNVVVAKNNLFKSNTTDMWGSAFAAGTDYNATNNASLSYTVTGGGNTHDRTSQTITFADEANDDFHLFMNDTGAKNKGLKLAAYSDDANLNFSNDIDGQQRTGDWSIGADEPFGVKTDQPHTVNTNNNIDNGLVLYQSFDGADIDWSNASAEARDKSGQNNHGDVSGATQVEGKKGQALSFDGANSYVNEGSASSLDTISVMTVSVWANVAGYGEGGQGYFVGKENAGLAGWRFKPLSTGSTIRFSLDYDGGTNLTVTSANNVLASSDFNKWIHWTVTWDGTNLAAGVHIYKDGVEISYGTRTDGVGNRVSEAAGDLIIGNNQVAQLNRTLDGKLDEVRIYNRVLSPTEITQLYNTGKQTINASQAGKNTNGLVGHWTFDGPDVNISTNAVTDRSGQNNTGTNHGATQTEGKLGQAFNFDGSSNYVDISSPTNLNISADITISAWINSRTVAAGIKGIASNTDNLNNNFQWCLELNRTAGKITFVQGSSNWIIVNNNTSLSANTWYHVAAVRTGSAGNWTITFYLNGVADGAPTGIYNPGANGHVHIADEHVMPNRNFDGSIDDVRVYNRALSATEIGDLYRLGSAKMKN